MKSRRMPRIVLADDHPLFLAGVRAILAEMPWVAAVGQTEQGDQVLELVGKARANLVLLGLGVRGITNVEVIRRLRQAHANVPAIVFTSFERPSCVEPLLKAGARGCLLRHAPSNDLERAIERVHRGGTFYSPEIAAGLLENHVNAGATASSRAWLTAREREVLTLVANGFTNKRIASELGISERTALSHRENLMAKLGLHSVATLTRLAVAEGLVPFEFRVMD
jgi:DNA-binding NarL/FixJ family response regulator